MSMLQQQRDFVKGTRVYHPRVSEWAIVTEITVHDNGLVWLSLDYIDGTKGRANPNELFLTGLEMRSAYVRAVPEPEAEEEGDEGEEV